MKVSHTTRYVNINTTYKCLQRVGFIAFMDGMIHIYTYLFMYCIYRQSSNNGVNNNNNNKQMKWKKKQFSSFYTEMRVPAQSVKTQLYFILYEQTIKKWDRTINYRCMMVTR